MPRSIKQGSSRALDEKLVRGGGITQAVRIDGEVRHIPVAPDSLSGYEEDLSEGLDDPNILDDPRRTGVGEHLYHDSPGAALPSDGFSLDGFRRQQSNSQLAQIINQAVNEIVAQQGDIYFMGWEQDDEFVQVTTDLVLASFDFNREEVIRAIRSRRVR